MAKPTAYAIAIAVALIAASGSAFAQSEATKNDVKKQNTVPLSPDGSMPDKNATQEPSSKVKGTQGEYVLQNGALTSGSGAPVNTDTVPSLFSEINAADDKMPIAAHTLKYLTDDQKVAIRADLEQQTKGATSDDKGVVKDIAARGLDVVGAEVPTDVALQNMRALPGTVMDRTPSMRGVTYLVSAEKFVLVDADSRMVIGTLTR